MAAGFNVMLNTLKTLNRPERPTRPTRPGAYELSPAQQEIKTYAEQVKEEDKPKIRPLQWIFDRLQTGQYVTANMVDQAIKNANKDDPLLQEVKEVLQAGWEGVTGQRKGSYEDILTEHTNLGEAKLFPDREGKFLGKLDAADILGFVGDVFLDPLTYVSFGATKMGTKAAKNYADDVARVTLKTFGKKLGTEGTELAKMAKKSFDPKYFKELLAESEEKALAYFARHAGEDVAREVNKIRKAAYKEALQTPAAELRDKMTAMTQDLVEKQKGKRSDDLAKLFRENLSGKVDSMDYMKKKDLLENTKSSIEEISERIPESYIGAGERKIGNFMGYEFGRKVRGLNPVERSVEIVGDAVKKLPGHEGLAKAWWGVMENGPVGEIRRKLGFRNPYQKMINLEYMEKGHHYHMDKLRTFKEKAAKATQDFGEEDKQAWTALVDMAEQAWTKEQPVTAFDLLHDPDAVRTLNLSAKQVKELEKLGRNVDGLMREWRNEYMAIASEGIVKEMGDIQNYLPVAFKDPNIRTSQYFSELGTSAPGYSLKRQYNRGETVWQEVTKFKKFFGVDEITAGNMVRKYNLSGLNMNLDELLQLRAYAQAQVEKRANIIRTFREFGVPTDEAKGVLKSSLNRPGGNLNFLGLETSDEMGLEGLLFDREVSQVINRVAASTDPKNVSRVQKMFIDFNSWWKGMATMTTGFHARNFISNNTTGFMVHGGKWFDLKKDRDALAAAIYTMNKVDPDKLLKEVNMDKGLYKMLLNRKYGQYSLKELADKQIQSGMLTEMQMGFNSPKSVVEKAKSLGKEINPFSLDFKGRAVSRKVGGWIENHSKFKSFLIDYEDMVARGADLAPDAAQRVSDEAMLFAERNAKKWWLDYADLSTFEQKTMKNIVPFYTWMRKNLVNQLEGILIYPHTFSIFPKTIEAFKYDDPEFDENTIPEWMRDIGIFPVGDMPGEGDLKLMFRPDMPFMDFNLIPLSFEEGRMWPKLDPSELKDDIVNAAHPVVKTIASAMTEKGYDFFRKQDLAEDAPAPLFMRFLTNNVDTLQYLDGVLRLSGVEGFQPKIDQNGKLTMNAKYLHFLETNMPLIRNLDILIEAGTAIGGLEEAIENATGYEDDYDKVEQVFRALSTFTGIKFYPFDSEEAEEELSRKYYYEGVRRRNEDIKKTDASAKRRTENRKRTNEIIRRMDL